jgi:NADH:ubiquinone oxidoreductase subunit E
MKISLIACIKDRVTGRPSCGGRGSVGIIDQIEGALKEKKLPIPVERIQCLGECAKGPNMRIAPGGRFFYGVNQETIPEVLAGLEEVFNQEEES